MDPADFRAQLEQELDWRNAEMRFFHNVGAALEREDQQRQFRGALILLIYSHFEGYCKFALALYASAINGLALACRDANSAIIAASLHDVFRKLRDGGGKAPEFRSKLPDDKKLHGFARDREFIERITEIMARTVSIPDSVVDTESNLNPVVLKKNLYRLGLPHNQFDKFDKSIESLLALRNKIAHGETRTWIDEKLYEDVKSSALEIMNGITVGITQALNEQWFLASRVTPPESFRAG